MNYTYILRCSDDTLYTGWTNNLEERVRTHNAGRGAKYTHSRTPVELVYYEIFGTKQEAMSRECAIKKLTRKQKEALIAGKTEKTMKLRVSEKISEKVSEKAAEKTQVSVQTEERV